ncbi:MAG: PQQ-binding-like beta-propeller repeat protein, partial [Ignavibacteria bacterium]|nr:PQQ-binding-like beta-propeller repeat protein [Ignavibacteria bacterium]
MWFKKFLLIIFFLVSAVLAQQVPKWTLELDDQIEGYNFLKDGNFLFLRSGENVFLYDAVTGQKIYSHEIDDYEKEGVHQIAGNNYFVSTSEAVRCYDALTGKLIWEKQYADIDQKEFGRLFFIGDVTVLRYGSVHVGIDLKTGNEIWRQDFGYNQQLY